MMSRQRKIGISIVFILAMMGSTLSLQAQQDNAGPGTIVTDRPDATEAPTLVPKGFLQVETGGFYESLDDNNVKTERTVYNTTLLRYGLLDNMELRVGWNLETRQTTIGGLGTVGELNGFSPLLLGVKVGIAEEKNGAPEIGLIGHLFLPFTASDDFKPQTTGADFRFAFSHTLSDKSNLSYNVGAQWGDDSPELAYIYTVAFGHSITKKFGFYVELYGDFPENTTANHFFDTGITYLLQPNIQLDATIGKGITDDQDILLSAGVSFRVPN
ncbi:transporter [Sediminicola sp. YIK13]|uniref:transporter n=1 Tax=Sediminicola sp. YIK13 TaxID=1453352 RepID=UPI000B1FE65F|nr:transporter [Sediminicola sp. YIK13]